MRCFCELLFRIGCCGAVIVFRKWGREKTVSPIQTDSLDCAKISRLLRSAAFSEGRIVHCPLSVTFSTVKEDYTRTGQRTRLKV